MNSLRKIALAAALTLSPLAAGAAQGGSDVGTHIYSPSPLIVQPGTAQRVADLPQDNGGNAEHKPVRIADAGPAGFYQPSPLITHTRGESLIAKINQAYGTSFATPEGNTALAMNGR